MSEDLVYDNKEEIDKLIHNTELYFSILSDIDQGVIILDRRFNIVFINKWIADLKGLHLDDILNCNVFDCIPSFNNESTKHLLEKSLTYNKQIISNERTFKDYKGKDHNYILKIKPFKGNKTVEGLMCIIKDVTYLKKLSVIKDLNKEISDLYNSQIKLYNILDNGKK